MRIHARSFAMTRSIHDHVWQQVGQVLDACDVHPDTSQVWLDDVNGDHGGEDKRCRIAVSNRIVGDIVVEAVDRDLYAAVEMAAGRLKVSLRKRLQRHRTMRREPITSWASLTFWGPHDDEPTPAA